MFPEKLSIYYRNVVGPIHVFAMNNLNCSNVGYTCTFTYVTIQIYLF